MPVVGLIVIGIAFGVGLAFAVPRLLVGLAVGLICLGVYAQVYAGGLGQAERDATVTLFAALAFFPLAAGFRARDEELAIAGGIIAVMWLVAQLIYFNVPTTYGYHMVFMSFAIAYVCGAGVFYWFWTYAGVRRSALFLSLWGICLLQLALYGAFALLTFPTIVDGQISNTLNPTARTFWVAQAVGQNLLFATKIILVSDRAFDRLAWKRDAEAYYAKADRPLLSLLSR